MKLAEVIAKVRSLEAKVASLVNVETRNSQLVKDVSEQKEIISELVKRDEFLTKINTELKFKLNQCVNKFERLETTVFNTVSLVNVLDNKSRDKNILINNVSEQQFETSAQLTANVKKIVRHIDKNVTVTKAYRAGEQSRNSQKHRPIIASLLDNQQRFSVVRHAHKLKYTEHKHVYITEDLCPEWKAARHAQAAMFNEKRQEYRNVYFRGKMLVYRNPINQVGTSITYSQRSPTASRSGITTSSLPNTRYSPTASAPGILATLPPVTEPGTPPASPSGIVNSSLPITRRLIAALPRALNSSPPINQRQHATSPPGISTSTPSFTQQHPPAASPPGIGGYNSTTTVKNKSRYGRIFAKPNRYTNNQN